MRSVLGLGLAAAKLHRWRVRGYNIVVGQHMIPEGSRSCCFQISEPTTVSTSLILLDTRTVRTFCKCIAITNHT